jgi:hypothetical protein
VPIREPSHWMPRLPDKVQHTPDQISDMRSMDWS